MADDLLPAEPHAHHGMPPSEVVAALLDNVRTRGDDYGDLANATADDLRDALRLAVEAIEALVDDVERLTGKVERLTGKAAAWQALAVEAVAIEPVMNGFGMVRCAFCTSIAAPFYLPKHKDGCLVLRVRARAGT